MAERIIQIFTKCDNRDSIEELVESNKTITYWINEGDNDKIYCYALVDGQHTQDFIDNLQQAIDVKDETHVLVQKIETFFPKPEEDEEDSEQEKAEAKENEATILREELENSLTKGATSDKHYFMLVFFSTIVAAIGMLENNIAVVVGAMVIAPFLGPNLALTFATAMSNIKLIKQSLKTLALGTVVALIVGVIVGQFYPLTDVSSELMSRTKVDFSSIVLALAAGCAAVLSLTQGVSSVLVGVMVAVALLPPLTAVALFFGHGMWVESTAAALLLMVNIVCINLSGLAMFMLKGIGPRTWWEKRKAKRAVYWASGVWLGILVVLTIIIALKRPEIVEDTPLEDPLLTIKESSESN